MLMILRSFLGCGLSVAFLVVLQTLLLYQEVSSYEFYLEGYAATDLSSGNNVDSVLITDTNRYSDGISSAGSYDITAPHFPYYHGALSNISDRYLRFTEYMKNAADQGIAGFGDGDKVREDAKLRILNKPNYADLPPPTKTFPVYAAIKWNPSDFAIQEGETYNITVLGSQVGFSSQFWTDGGIRVNAHGYESYYDPISRCHVAMGKCRPHLKKKRRLPTANWMSLSCAIGRFVRNVNAIQPGLEHITSWVPLDESTLTKTIFNVGLSTVFRAEFSGQLICFANDAHALYWNNQGVIQVTATRVSWPPSDEIYYKPMELPACDSAYAVYNELTEQPGVLCNPDGGGSGWEYKDIIRE